jgi:hypothetical protein
MQMNWEKITFPSQEITELRSTIRDSELQLTWFWPKEIDFVYIYKASVDNLREISELEERDLMLYTREEYKANQGYLARLDTIGRYAYRILPCQRKDGSLLIFRQENAENLIYISGGKAKIHFSISYKNKLFQRQKRVKMSIMTELPLDKELLCFVKKRDAVPISPSDGTWYPFVQDFPSGKTLLPEIEIDKNDYIRIFFGDGRKSAESYQLIPE